MSAVDELEAIACEAVISLRNELRREIIYQRSSKSSSDPYYKKLQGILLAFHLSRSPYHLSGARTTLTQLINGTLEWAILVSRPLGNFHAQQKGGENFVVDISVCDVCGLAK